jgi:hypothetical protein
MASRVALTYRSDRNPGASVRSAASSRRRNACAAREDPQVREVPPQRRGDLLRLVHVAAPEQGGLRVRGPIGRQQLEARRIAAASRVPSRGRSTTSTSKSGYAS